MITAPEHSSDAETLPLAAPEATPAAAGEIVPVAVPRKVWLMRDLVLLGTVGLLAIVALVTAVRRHRHAQGLDRLAKDLTTASSAFQTYMKEHSAVPADSAAGVVPAGMAAYLKDLDWTAPTAVGGTYRWTHVPAVEPVGAAGAAPAVPSPGTGVIALTAFAPGPALELSAADLLELDRRLDDGNLATGKFRTGFNGWPVLTVSISP